MSYYVLVVGRRAREDGLGFRPSPGVSLALLARRHPAVVYLGPIAMLTLLMVAAAAVYVVAQGGSAFFALLAVALTFLPALALGPIVAPLQMLGAH